MPENSFSPFGTDLFGDPMNPENRGALAERFEFPPFSVLDARQGEWQDRKRAWLTYGIKSEVGRDIPPTSIAKNVPDYIGNRGNNAGGSIFDPVICELAYRWFCPEGGQVVDPFAGGSVRGIVAAMLGLSYWGCDLREEQIQANEIQRDEIIGLPLPGMEHEGNLAEWVQGDAIERLDDAPDADLIFTCPPYGDLERYSDDPRDLSTMDYHAFVAAFKRIIFRCAVLLKPGHFACFVVSDFRDKRRGNYRGFVADTITACRECGLHLYNDAVLVTSVGSLPIRAGKQFTASKKLGKSHQNVLVFVKGDYNKWES